MLWELRGEQDGERSLIRVEEIDDEGRVGWAFLRADREEVRRRASVPDHAAERLMWAEEENASKTAAT